MRNPGIWTLGAVGDNDRDVGRMDTVVEYAGKSGTPEWTRPPQPPWDYTIFGEHVPEAELPPEKIMPMVIDRVIPGADGIEKWTINGEYYDGRPIRLHAGQRYRLAFQNNTDDDHPVQLHHYSFELMRISEVHEVLHKLNSVATASYSRAIVPTPYARSHLSRAFTIQLHLSGRTRPTLCSLIARPPPFRQLLSIAPVVQSSHQHKIVPTVSQL